MSRAPRSATPRSPTCRRSGACRSLPRHSTASSPRSPSRSSTPRPDARVVYVMTDGASLPIVISDLVHELRSRDLLDATITCGQAFGGDHDAISLQSALAIAPRDRARRRCDRGNGTGERGYGDPPRLQRHRTRRDRRRRRRPRRHADRRAAVLGRRSPRPPPRHFAPHHDRAHHGNAIAGDRRDPERAGRRRRCDRDATRHGARPDGGHRRVDRRRVACASIQWDAPRPTIPGSSSARRPRGSLPPTA